MRSKRRLRRSRPLSGARGQSGHAGTVVDDRALGDDAGRQLVVVRTHLRRATFQPARSDRHGERRQARSRVVARSA